MGELFGGYRYAIAVALSRDGKTLAAGLGQRAVSSGGRGDERELAVAEQKWGIGMAYQISCVYASRNDPDRAMDWLERAYQQHDAGLISMLHDPMLRNLERGSRFQALLRKMHLSQ